MTLMLSLGMNYGVASFSSQSYSICNNEMDIIRIIGTLKSTNVIFF
jgi:hypothetical protein